MSASPETFLPVLTIIGATLSGTAVIIGGALAFLWSRFSSVYRRIDEKSEQLQATISHNRNNADLKFLNMNDAMQERHEENLEAFEKIRLCLAKAGIWNGLGSIRRPDRTEN